MLNRSSNVTLSLIIVGDWWDTEMTCGRFVRHESGPASTEISIVKHSSSGPRRRRLVTRSGNGRERGKEIWDSGRDDRCVVTTWTAPRWRMMMATPHTGYGAIKGPPRWIGRPWAVFPSLLNDMAVPAGQDMAVCLVRAKRRSKSTTPSMVVFAADIVLICSSSASTALQRNNKWP
jgi:hypothetical protein